MNLSAALAYNLLSAIFPILLAILAIAAFILGQNATQVVSKLTSVLPGIINNPSLAESALKQYSRASGPFAIIAFVVAVFGGSRLFILMENCFSIIYRVRPRTFIPQNLMAFGMLLLFILLIPIMFFAASIPNIILSLLQNPNLHLNSIPGSSFIFGAGGIIAGYVSGIVVGFILFSAIYFVVPNQKINFSPAWKGALFAAIALELYVSLFTMYATHFLNGYVGQAGFAVILLTFFYYFAVILLIGAEVNAFFSEKVKPLPNDIVTFVSTMGGKLNKDIPEDEGKAHVNPTPTDNEDKAHIAEALNNQQQNQHHNDEEQQEVATRAYAKDKAQEHKQHQQEIEKQKPSKALAAVSVLVGSIVTVIVESFRLRNHGN